MFWIFRFRQPMGVKTMQIETITTTVEEAEELGRLIISQKMPGPGYRFVAVEPLTVGRSVDFPDLVQKWGGQAAEPVAAPPVERPAQARTGRVGA